MRFLSELANENALKVGIGGALVVEKVTAVRQELCPVVADSMFRLVERRCDRWRSAFRADDAQPIVRARREDDHVFGVPRAASTCWCLTQHLRGGSPVHVDLFELSTSKKCKKPTVGRPE